MITITSSGPVARSSRCTRVRISVRQWRPQRGRFFPSSKARGDRHARCPRAPRFRLRAHAVSRAAPAFTPARVATQRGTGSETGVALRRYSATPRPDVSGRPVRAAYNAVLVKKTPPMR